MFDRFGAGTSSSDMVKSMTSGCARFWPLEPADIEPLADMALLGVCTEYDRGVPPPMMELTARVSDISIKSSSDSSSLSEYPDPFDAEASTLHDPSVWIVTESTDRGVFARISLKYLQI